MSKSRKKSWVCVLYFQERVEGEFFVTQLEGKALCLLVSGIVTVLN